MREVTFMSLLELPDRLKHIEELIGTRSGDHFDCEYPDDKITSVCIGGVFNFGQVTVETRERRSRICVRSSHPAIAVQSILTPLAYSTVLIPVRYCSPDPSNPRQDEYSVIFRPAEVAEIRLDQVTEYSHTGTEVQITHLEAVELRLSLSYRNHVGFRKTVFLYDLTELIPVDGVSGVYHLHKDNVK